MNNEEIIKQKLESCVRTTNGIIYKWKEENKFEKRNHEKTFFRGYPKKGIKEYTEESIGFKSVFFHYLKKELFPGRDLDFKRFVKYIFINDNNKNITNIRIIKLGSHYASVVDVYWRDRSKILTIISLFNQLNYQKLSLIRINKIQEVNHNIIQAEMPNFRDIINIKF